MLKARCYALIIALLRPSVKGGDFCFAMKIKSLDFYWKNQDQFGRSVIIGFQKTQLYQRFAGSRQEVFILKIQNDESNAAQQDNGRRFHIEIKQKQGQYFLLFLFDSIELLSHHSLQKHPRLLLQRYSDRSV